MGEERKFLERIFDESNNFTNRLEEIAFCGRFKEFESSWDELQGIGVANEACSWHVTLHSAIVFQGESNVPSRSAMMCPRSSLIRFVVHDDASTWRYHGEAIEVIVSKEVSVGGKLGINSGLA